MRRERMMNQEIITARKWEAELRRARNLPEFADLPRELDIPFLMALVSRETLWGWSGGYTRKGQSNGLGDRGHGHGFFQIDDRSHRVFLSLRHQTLDGRIIPVWWYPYEQCVYALRIFQSNLKSLNGDFEAATAAYNCGAGNVRHAIRRGRRVDAYTTGHNYSRDVFRRRTEWQKIFQP